MQQYNEMEFAVSLLLNFYCVSCFGGNLMCVVEIFNVIVYIHLPCMGFEEVMRCESCVDFFTI